MRHLSPNLDMLRRALRVEVCANCPHRPPGSECFGSDVPRISIWMTGLRENLHELPGVIDLAARLGVDEVYLQRLVFWGEGLATADQSLLATPAETVEGVLREAERRARGHGISFRGADAQTPRATLLERPEDREPWRSNSGRRIRHWGRRHFQGRRRHLSLPAA